MMEKDEIGINIAVALPILLIKGCFVTQTSKMLIKMV